MDVIEGALTADAILRRTQEFTTKTIDGVLMKRIFMDDFNRTVEKGLGGKWGPGPYSSVASVEDWLTSVDGSAMVFYSPVAAANWDEYVGFPFPASGDLFFDFNTGTFTAGLPMYGFTLDNYQYCGIYVYQSGTEGTWEMFTWFWDDDPAITFSVTANTWYRVHLRWTEDNYYARVWQRDDPEPTTWDIETTNQLFGYGNDNVSPFLDLYTFPQSPTVSKIDNIEIWSTANQWTFHGSFPASAQLSVYAVRHGNWSSNAVLKKGRLGSLSADAYIVNPYRTQHPRDNTAQYDFDLDTVVTMAKAFDVYTEGEDLHSVLTSVVGRVTALENADSS